LAPRHRLHHQPRRRYRIIVKNYVNGSLDETRHLYYSDDWQVLEERIGSSTDPNRQYIWGLRYIDDLLLRDRDTTANGTLYERLYALQDGNWNTTAITDENGDVQERYAYSAYGTPSFLSPTFTSRASSDFEWDTLYSGYRYNALTGLFAVRNRAYHPTLGTWLTRDPADFDMASLYRYVSNSPPTFTDPSGLEKTYLTKEIEVFKKSRDLSYGIKRKIPAALESALSDIRLQPTRPKRSGVGPVVEFFVAIAGRR